MTWKKKVGALVASFGLVVGSAGAAHAVTIYPSAGGTWEYGNGVVQAYSNYHKDSNHTSSLYKNGTLQSGNVCVGTGWSYATSYHAPWTGGFAYYYNPSC